MRSLVTHKKLKEIALSQQGELGELRTGLEKLRLRTYPTFVDMSAVPAAPQPPRRLPPDVKMATGSSPLSPPGASGGMGAGMDAGPPLRT
ncbi:hypothetical protein TSOC_008377 [Tetrabaena socialis]|uniref:Uncharacterized protein n=1 Tax=Tetrabaena socialis TaxID=47790 RepID=A0A2J7ZYN7_9CHLO|nr:hypothetical protein TSOC_008377 [Tetrabaena socialis]|eukprot:PNH05368.1 hypothetical protein TSOC_008377 [Tetrabaena socialis]